MLRYINVSELGPVKVYIKCADQGNFIRGGSRPGGKKTALTAFFCLFVLCSPQPINRGVPMVLFQWGLSFSRGSNFFQVGGGVQILISIETYL